MRGTHLHSSESLFEGERIESVEWKFTNAPTEEDNGSVGVTVARKSTTVQSVQSDVSLSRKRQRPYFAPLICSL